MENLRTYREAPFGVAVVHGGPGAAGEMAPVARELAAGRGVLEPIQTATSVLGQVEELREVLERYAALPATLIGFSWGAWLSYLVAAHHPALVRKLILVGSGPFEEKYVARLGATRAGRLSDAERGEFVAIIQELGAGEAADKDALLARLGELAAKTDSYDPLPAEPDDAGPLAGAAELYQQVWEGASALRQSGEPLELGKQIRCPVIAIHGDYDPHPAEGVRVPLAGVLADFRFISVEKCGHAPWLERQARDTFFEILRGELVRQQLPLCRRAAE